MWVWRTWTTSCKNVETLPWKNNLSWFKLLLVIGLWGTDFPPPSHSKFSSKFWVWSCIASKFDKERGSQGQDHGEPIYAKIRYSVSSTFATGCSLGACDPILYIHVAISWQMSKQCIRRPVSPNCITGSSIHPLNSPVFFLSYPLTGYYFSNDCRLSFNFSKCIGRRKLCLWAALLKFWFQTDLGCKNEIVNLPWVPSLISIFHETTTGSVFMLLPAGIFHFVNN